VVQNRRAVKGAAIAAVLALGTVPVFASASFAKGSGSSSPASPTAVSLVSGNRALSVAWSESSSGRITFVATATAAGRTTRKCTSKSTRCQISSLENGAVYDVTVVASTKAGASGPSSPVSAIVGVPGPPLSVRTTPSLAASSVTWGPPKASGVSNPTGYMATASPGGFSCSTVRTILSAPARTCEIPGLTPGTTYEVTVTATNAYGTGVPSRSVAVTAS
jgi:hypothetical protein